MTTDRLFTIESQNGQRLGYATADHLVLAQRRVVGGVRRLEAVLAPLPYHPATPLIFLHQLASDWALRGELTRVPLAWRLGLPVHPFKRKKRVATCT